MRTLLKPFYAWMLFVVLTFSTWYAVCLSCRMMLSFVQQEFARQFAQGAHTWLDRR